MREGGRGTRRALALLFAAALGLLAPPLARASSPRVDWQRRVVVCQGLGAPTLREASANVGVARVRTEREARRAARRACLEALGMLVVEGIESAEALLSRDAKLKAAVEMVVERSSQSADLRYFADGGTAVGMEVPMDGALTDALLEAALPSLGIGGEAGTETRPQAPANGILVDATTCAVVPALAPRLLDPEGHAVYEVGMLLRSVRSSGGAAYLREGSPTSAWPRERIGDAPRVVRAVRAVGADLILSAVDAESLRGDPALHSGRVAILLGGNSP